MKFYKTTDLENRECYGFTFNSMCITDPYTSDCGRFDVESSYYGLTETDALILHSINTLTPEETQRGGGHYVYIYTLSDNKIIVVDDELIGLYESYNHFDWYNELPYHGIEAYFIEIGDSNE
jgi:hypothetical protein